MKLNENKVKIKQLGVTNKVMMKFQTLKTCSCGKILQKKNQMDKNDLLIKSH